MFHGSVFVKQCVKIELILFHGYGVEFWANRLPKPRPTLLHTHGIFSNFEFVKALTFYLSDIHVVIIKNRIW